MSTFKVVAYNDETPPKEVALPSAPTVAGDNPTLADVVYDSAANVITVTRKPGQPSGVETLTATLGSHTAQLAVQVPNNDVASIAIVPTP